MSVYISEQMNRQLLNLVQDVAERCVSECASRYGFDYEEAIRMLNLSKLKVDRKKSEKKSVKASKVSVPKAAFPLPYNGELNENCCYALRQNNGLYTQCQGDRKGDASFCKGCARQMQKIGAEMPEYGTIQQRKAVGIFEYVDPKGRKPVSYTKVMKKYKLTEEQVLEEAGKLNIVINPEHFVAPVADSKRGRPKTEKETKVKGAKGRPKKSKKVLQIEGEEDDLFAALVAEANEVEDVLVKKVKGKSEEEKEAERLAKEAEKEAKRIAAEQAKAEKEAKLAAEKAEREAKKEAERLEREAKKKAEEEAKEAKRLALEQAKKEKEAKLAAEKAAKEAAKANKTKKVEEPVEDEEPDVVKKIEFEGKKYLKSKKSGIIYDYNEYVKNSEQVVIGKWNEKTNKIDFTDDGEESEEEYEM